MNNLIQASAKTRLLYSIVFVFLLFILIKIFQLQEYANAVFIRDLFNHNSFLAISVFIILFCLANISYIPGWIFLATSVYLFGKINGGLLVFLAAIISSLFSFFVLRMIFGRPLTEIQVPKIQKIMKKFQHNEMFGVTVLRLIFQTNPFINYALAFSSVRAKNYIMGTLLGLPLPIIVYCYFFETFFNKVL